MDNSGSKSVNIKAKGGSITSGRSTVTGNFPTGSQPPEFSVSGSNHGGTPSNTNLTIEALDSDISLADDTAFHINVQTQTSNDAGSDPPSGSISTHRSPDMDDAGATTLSTDNRSPDTDDTRAATLHFLVHEKGKYIQIGQCCVIVEMHVNESLMEKLKSEGTLEVDTQIGTSVVTMRWRGLETNEELRTQIKLRLTSSLTESLEVLERSVLEDLVNNHCDKCQTLVSYLMREVKGHLTEVSLGCLQLTLIFTCQEDLERGTSREAIQKLHEFLSKLLVTEKLQQVAEDIGFSVAVEDRQHLAQSQEDQPTTTLYKREDITSSEKDLSVSEMLEKEMSKFRSFLSRELTTLRAGQSREIMTQEQLARQVASQVQQTVTQEWELFHQTHIQAVHNTITELLPELEQRVYRNVLTKINEESLGLLREHTEEFPVPVYSTTRPVYSTIRPSRVTPIYPLEIDDIEEPLSSEDKISELLDIVHSKPQGPTILNKVDVHQRTQAVDFSGFFDAIQKPREKEESEKESLSQGSLKEKSEKESLSQGSLRGTMYENLVKIWGEDGMKVVQHALEMATAATETLDDREICDQFVTVLCLDLSHSMAGKYLKQQRVLAEKIIQNCLGHVAVVSFSGEVCVEQDFTENRDYVKKVLGQLQIEPVCRRTSTPALQAIFTVLRLLHQRVRPTDYGRYHTLYPKVVLISDGLFNDCSPETENSAQPCQKTDDLLASVLEVMVAMNIRIPIYFVPVREQPDSSAGWMDMVRVVEDVEFLTNSEATEALIGSVMEAIALPKQAQTPWKSWQTIKKELKRKHIEADSLRVEWFITEHFKQPPPIGTRIQIVSSVHQPTEQEQFKQPSSPAPSVPDELTSATVLQHVKGPKAKQDTKTKYVLVVLDTGEKQFFPWRFDQERLLFYRWTEDSGAVLPVGTLVRRGKHWNYKNQDGGPDEIGVVITSKSGGGSVKVCWRSHLADQELNVYRYGDQDRYDIEIAESPLIDLAGLIDLGFPNWKMHGETGTLEASLEEGVVQMKRISRPTVEDQDIGVV